MSHSWLPVVNSLDKAGELASLTKSSVFMWAVVTQAGGVSLCTLTLWADALKTSWLRLSVFALFFPDLFLIENSNYDRSPTHPWPVVISLGVEWIYVKRLSVYTTKWGTWCRFTSKNSNFPKGHEEEENLRQSSMRWVQAFTWGRLFNWKGGWHSLHSGQSSQFSINWTPLQICYIAWWTFHKTQKNQPRISY